MATEEAQAKLDQAKAAANKLPEDLGEVLKQLKHATHQRDQLTTAVAATEAKLADQRAKATEAIKKVAALER